MTYDNTEEQPLDPVMERVRKKMIRLMAISIGIMMVGLFAVLFAIIYKFSNQGEDQERASGQVPGSAVETNLGLPSSSEILSSSVHENRLVLDIRSADGSRQYIFIDIVTGRVTGKINVN